MTTICLLQYYCESKTNPNNNQIEFPFTIEYGKTNACWQKSFKNWCEKKNDTFKEKNIDNYHIVEVYECITKKISSKKTAKKLEDVLKHVKFIWSDITEDSVNYDNAIKNFTNINSNKIKLTCAELIKAIFLQQNIYWEVNVSADSSITDEEERLVQAVRSLVKTSKEANVQRDYIARKWDEYERMLGDDDFWYFLYDQESGSDYETRIEYIFNLIFKVKKGDNPLKAFNELYKSIIGESSDTKRIKKIREQWENVGKYLTTLHNWWKDKEMYHLIGFLVCVTPWINPNLNGDKSDEHNNNNKVSVIHYLINGFYGDNTNWTKKVLMKEIRKYIISSFSPFLSENEKTIDETELTYSNRDNVRRALLFFNIDTILKQKSDNRFPFKAYKTERWDIEHIASQTDFNPNSKKGDEQKNWCLALLQYFTGVNEEDITSEHEKSYSNGKKHMTRVFDKEKFLKKKEDINKDIEDIPDAQKKELCRLLRDMLLGVTSDIRKIQERVNAIFNVNDTEKDYDKDGIGNLTLLNMSVNRGYGNAIFPIKRMKIIQEAEDGYYIPICTQKVFQKAYSRQFDQLYEWTSKDQEAYQTAIIKAIEEFCTEQ